MLKQLKMYEHLTTTAKTVNQLNTQHYIGCNVQGIFYSKLKAGDTVTKGEQVGYTTDEFGKVLETYTAPTSGIILYKISTPAVNVDDGIMCIGSKS